jgi:glycolate oxidase FAD binding subunit
VISPSAPTDVDWIAKASEAIRQAAARKRPLRITGHSSKAFYGMPEILDADAFSTLGHCGITDYDPTELVVVVKCGTPITELESVLAASRQMLAFEPPRFGGRGTVGGMMASGLSGPRRATAGAAKDFVLGMTVLDGQATPLRYGGTVMKNVAGYDLSRLHTGALGTLGLMVDLSIKVLPMPPAQATLAFDVDAPQAIEWMNAWGGQPLPISATSWHEGRLMVRLSGAMAAVQSAKEKLGGELMADAHADAFWNRLRDHHEPFFSVSESEPDVCLWRLSLPSVTPHAAEMPGQQWMEWGGALRWLKSNASAASIRALASRHGGHATLFRAPRPELRQQAGVFTELPVATMRIHERLKQELDADRIFNPGRMYAGL